ncbi:SCO6880 family protein [Nocardioides lijunqiniae]|uniref:SCO6880 family protein n=1 Tax=Nocardioides lijunqiniae TaxID=2760832 RepID=UPI001877721A|nr:SCO6880 family protein [Nocardioides lijunqiniae]
MSTTTSTRSWQRTEGTPTRTYGNWVEQKGVGIAGAGLVGTAVLIGGLVVIMMAMLIAGPIGAVVVGAVVAVAFLATGTPLGTKTVRRYGYRRARRAREHQFRSGVFTRNSNPAIRLPGLLGRTSLLEKTDAFGAPFVVIKNPSRGGMYTIVAKCVADGPWMQDQEQLDAWVAGWSRVLTAAGQEPGLIGGKAIIDTAPDPGGRLAAAEAARRSPNAPALAAQVMDECVAAYPASSSENVTYVELTFRARDLDRKGNEDRILSELSRRVPGLMGRLGSAGGGAVTMLTKAELPAIVRVAFDPAAAPFLEQAAIHSPDHPDLAIDWSDAGPVAYQDFWDRFVHDSGVSVTWEMFGAPRAAITELSAAALLMPHSDFARKRVALVFRPKSPEASVKASESDANASMFMSSQGKKRTTALQKMRVRATEQSREEVAAGAVMVQFSLLVTVTVTSPDGLDQAASTLAARAGTVPLRLRRCYGSQAAGFATTLPAGFVPWEHTVIPDRVREVM